MRRVFHLRHNYYMFTSPTFVGWSKYVTVFLIMYFIFLHSIVLNNVRIIIRKVSKAMKNKRIIFKIFSCIAIVLLSVFVLEACAIGKKDNPMLVVEVQDNSKQEVIYDAEKTFNFSFLAAQDNEGPVTYELVSARDEDGKDVDYFKLVSADKTDIEVKKGIDAGTYTLDIKVKAEGNNNYKPLEKTITYLFTVEKAKGELKAPKAIENLVYNGKPQALVEPGETKTGELQYKLNEDGEYSTDIPEATEAGVYTVYYKVVGDKNHKDVHEEFVLVSIDRQNVAYRPRSYSYSTGSSFSLSGLLSNMKNSTSFTRHITNVPVKPGEYVEYLYDGKQHNNGYHAPSGIIMAGIDSATNAGRYVAYYTPDLNHAWPDGSRDTVKVLMEIKKIDPKVSFETYDITYNGLPQKLLKSSTVDGGSVVYSFDNTVYTVSIPSARDAGTYKLFYKVLGDLNHNDIHGTLNITINKKPLTAPSINTQYTYNGLPQTVKVEDFNVIYMSYDKNSTLVATDAGEYKVIVKLNHPENYCWPNRSSDNITLNWTIDKAEGSVYREPKAKIAIYTGKQHRLIDPGKSLTGTMMYRLEDGEYSEDIPYATDAGTYKVYYYAKGDNNHYDSSESFVEATIAKIPPLITSYPLGRILDYDGQEHEMIINGKSNHGYFEFSADGENYSREIPMESEVNIDYEYSWRFVGDKNHTDVKGFYPIYSSIVIREKAQYTVRPVANEYLTYTGQPQELITAGSSDQGQVVYKLSWQDEFSSEIPTATEVGTYDIEYKIIGDEYHLDSDISTIRNVTIDEGYLYIEADDQLFVYNGEPQGDPITVETQDGTEAFIEYRYGISPYTTTAPEFANVSLDLLGRVQSRTVHYRVSAPSHKSQEGTYTITIDRLQFDMPYLENPTLTYNETQQVPGLQNIDYDYMDISGAQSAMDAGRYYINIRLNDIINTKWTDQDTPTVILGYNIEKASVEMDDIVPIEGLKYTGYPQALIDYPFVNGGTILYSLDGSKYSEDLPQATDDAYYTITYKVKADKNHIDRAPIEIQTEIEPADMEVVVEDQTYTYNGQPQGEKIYSVTTVNDLPYRIMFSEQDDVYYAEYDPKATDAGSKTIYYIVEAEHHNNVYGEYTLTIEKAPGSFTLPTLSEGLVYNGTAQPLVSQEATSDTGTILYSLDGINYDTQIPYATNAGVYTVHCYSQGDNNHYDTATFVKDVTIAKVPVDIPQIENTVFDYNGQPQGPTVHDYNGALIFEQGERTSVDAGTYTLLFGLRDKVNYCWSDNTSDDVTYTYTINKVDSSITTHPTSKQLVYNAKAQTIVENGQCVGGQLVYSLDGVNFYETISATDAKEYTVYYKVIGDNNHNDTEIYSLTATINKADIVVSQLPAPIQGLVFNNNYQTLITAGITNIDTDTYSPLQYSVNESEFSYSLPTGLDAGSYRIDYKIDNIENYNTVGEFESIYVTIDRAPNPLAVSQNNLITLNASQPNVIDISNYIYNPVGYLEYQISDVNGATTDLIVLDNSLLTLSDTLPAGIYNINILVSATGDTSYLENTVNLNLVVELTNMQQLNTFNLYNSDITTQIPVQETLQDRLIQIYDNYEQFIDSDGKISLFKIEE